MLNLRVSSARWFQQRPKKCLRQVFPLTRRQGNSNCFLTSRHVSDPGPVVQTVEDRELGRRCSLTSTAPKTLCSLPTFANRGPDDCGANSSSVAALCGAACGTHDTSGVVPSGNACRRGLRGRPSRGNHGGPDHRFAPGRCLLEVWDGPRLRLVQQ
jgi:hypothetical protein